jgi:hypothetical protein
MRNASGSTAFREGRPGVLPHSRSDCDGEVERRLAHVLEALAHARERWREAQRAVHVAKDVLITRKLEREEAAMRLAELADLAECLQRTLADRRNPSRS